MNVGSVKKRVNLDGFHSLDISVYEKKKTVITELIILNEDPIMIYAEKFDEPCDYLKTGIRRGIQYLNASIKTDSNKQPKIFLENNEPN